MLIYIYRLGIDYIDLYLIHSPAGGKILETWDTMVELQQQGLIRYVGGKGGGHCSCTIGSSQCIDTFVDITCNCGIVFDLRS